MKKLIILLFILVAIPTKAAIVKHVVCTDHSKRTTDVYTNVNIPQRMAALPFEQSNAAICKKLKYQQYLSKVASK